MCKIREAWGYNKVVVWVGDQRNLALLKFDSKIHILGIDAKLAKSVCKLFLIVWSFLQFHSWAMMQSAMPRICFQTKSMARKYSNSVCIRGPMSEAMKNLKIERNKSCEITTYRMCSVSRQHCIGTPFYFYQRTAHCSNSSGMLLIISVERRLLETQYADDCRVNY